MIFKCENGDGVQSKITITLIFTVLSMLLLAGCPSSTSEGENLGINEPDPAHLPQSLKIVVFASKCPLPTDCSADYIEKAAQDVANLNPDVVIATEFFWKKENYINFAKKVGLKFHTRGPGNDQNSVTGGVVLMSRFPFSDVKKDIFSDSVLPDNLVKKGTVIGRIRIGKSKAGDSIAVNLIGTHYQAKAVGDWITAQSQQISQQATFIDQGSNANEFAILGGDFNLTQTVPQWLCSDAECADKIKASWNKLNELILSPRRFLSASQICQSDSPILGCIGQSLNEENGQDADVIKLLISNTSAFSVKGVNLVPRAISSVGTISDHLTWVSKIEVHDESQ